MHNHPRPVPTPVETDWLARLYRLADNVDLGLSHRETARTIRSVIDDMYSERQRATTLANATGASGQEASHP